MARTFNNSNITNFNDFFEYDFGFDIPDNIGRIILNIMIFVSLISHIPLIWNCWNLYKNKTNCNVNYSKIKFKIFISILWIITGFVRNDYLPIISSFILIIFSILSIHLSTCN